MALTLTEREYEVINAIINGNTATKELAKMLAIKRKTAENHLYNIKQKTGVRKAGLPYWVKRNLEDVGSVE